IHFLEEAFDRGFERYHIVATDSDLDSMRSDARFIDLIKRHYADAVNRTTAVLETHKVRDDAVNALGWLQLFANGRDKIDEGIDYAKRARGMNADEPNYHGTLAELLAARGNYKEAVIEITTAVSKD